VSLQTFYKHKI